MKNKWKVEYFKPETIQSNLDNKIFTVPLYQRGVVWSDDQRNDLVDTIKKGLPFGTLLLYKSSDENKYQIIDGLQRSTALTRFAKNPSQFFADEDIDDSVLKNIAALIGVNGNQKEIVAQIKDILIKWVKSHDSLSSIESMQFYSFGAEVVKEFPTCIGKEFEIGQLITPMMMEFRSICKTINDTEVPALVLEGDADLLPLLFERINSKGTELSKYQIYAASWMNESYKIDEEFIDIVKANRDRYDLMLQGDASLDDYDATDFLNNRILNTFEICFGLGKYLCNRWPHLFGSNQMI